MEDTYVDDIGRMFCTKHKRATCHDCCFDFAEMNESMEVDVGLRKPKSEVEQVAEELAVANFSLRGMATEMGMGPNNRAYQLTERFQDDAKRKLDDLRAKGATEEEINEAMRKAIVKCNKQEVDRNALIQAAARANPGKRTFNVSGAEMQRLYDQVVAPPELVPEYQGGADKFTCAYCKKSGAKKLMMCSRCKCTYYCGKECQHKAWKAHKKYDCIPRKADPKSLPLTWEQVEARAGLLETGRVLEVRAIMDESVTRQVFQCKDRAGVIHRVAVYTNSRKIPGLKQGSTLKWKNPRFHCFMDGSAGARIEEEDLENVKVINI